MTQRLLFSLRILLCLSAAGAVSANAGSGVEIKPYGATLRITIDGKPFSDYHYQNVSRPFFYPVIGPKEVPLTRNWPMGDGPGEAHDHPHHKSLWYAHGDINGVDFWSESPRAGTTVQTEFLEITSGAKSGTIRTSNELRSKEGELVATDDRTMTIHARDGEARMMDFDITIHASNGELVLGDTKEGSMGMRLAPTMRLKGEVGEGHIVNSAGDRDGTTWGRRAAWCDYYGPVNGETVGVAIFDHPSNPRHPTWWHVRDYGLFAANPFGLHYFEKKPEGTGNMKIAAGGSVTFRYRFYFHLGDEKSGKVAEEFERYAAE